DAIDNRALARVDGVRELGRDEPWPAAAMVVDALLGTGAAGPARGDVLAMAQRLVAYAAPVLAVDGPTGPHPSSGEAHGPAPAPRSPISSPSSRRSAASRSPPRSRPWSGPTRSSWARGWAASRRAGNSSPRCCSARPSPPSSTPTH